MMSAVCHMYCLHCQKPGLTGVVSISLARFQGRKTGVHLVYGRNLAKEQNLHSRDQRFNSKAFCA